MTPAMNQSGDSSMLKDPMFASDDARRFMSDVTHLEEKWGFGVTPIRQAGNVPGGWGRKEQRRVA